MQIRDLVAAHLRPIQSDSSLMDSEFQLVLGAQACPIAAEAVAHSGVGLDHFHGEYILAAMLQRETPRGYEHRLCGAITDRRLIVGGWSSIIGGYNDTRFSVAHADVSQAEWKASAFQNHLKLTTHQGQLHTVTFPAATKHLGPLYQQLTSLPPQARVAPGAPMPQPSTGDPAGCLAIGGALWREDPGVSAMLAHLDQQVRAGQLDPSAGYDLAGRLLLLHRSAMSGPGGNGQQWLTPLSSSDLVHLLASIFGAPMQLQPLYQGYHSYQFRVDPQRDALGPVLSGLGVVAFVGLGIGFSPGKLIAHHMMQKKPMTEFRVSVADATGCSMFLLDGPKGRLENGEGMFNHQLHQALIHSSYGVLHGRVHRGWGVDYSALFT